MRYEIAHPPGHLEAVDTTQPGDAHAQEHHGYGCCCRVCGGGEPAAAPNAAAGWPMLTGGESEVVWAQALWTEIALRHTDARWWITHYQDLPAALQAGLTDPDRIRLRKIHQASPASPATPASPPEARTAPDDAPLTRRL